MTDILFLDIDGVLNRRGTKERCGQFLGVDRELSGKFLKWLRSTNVKIVLSSTWRNHDWMYPHLHEAGIEWIDVTPKLGGWRGHEIKAWLVANPDKWDRYAIIDDIKEMLDEQMDRFVNTDTDVGITDDHIEQLNRLFAVECKEAA